jgi:hypothetical protein
VNQRREEIATIEGSGKLESGPPCYRRETEALRKFATYQQDVEKDPRVGRNSAFKHDGR